MEKYFCFVLLEINTKITTNKRKTGIKHFNATKKQTNQTTTIKCNFI